MTAGGYYREGTLQAKEPNDVENFYPYSCAGANYTQAYGAPAAWGWADTDCTKAYIFMCKNASKWSAAGIRRALSPQDVGCCMQQNRSHGRPRTIALRRATLLRAGNSIATYASPNTSHTYTFSSVAMNFSSSEAWCQTQGGHLASYNSELPACRCRPGAA